ncbi:xylanase [Capsulimonas corticalis]|uniref:Xylanase n=1 Tax=Capsulimonas corticalis TaxID=2219043 RepID=A0A402CVP5_9BACT|nr:alpha/beta hydrolase [Capsulimonas corticalis]BDI30475.1 xylanase [Capsulimonas corticalis]
MTSQRLAALLSFSLLIGCVANGQADTPATPSPITFNLWPNTAPGETGSSAGDAATDSTGRYGEISKLSNITCPQLTVYPIADGKKTHPTVLIFPGGGYYVVTTDIEGSEIAHWLNGLGCAAAVLHYRVPDGQVPSPQRREPAFQDAQRAMSLLRSRAGEFGIDPARLGVIGFSAGGHLAARLSCSDGARTYDTVDAADKFSDRPSFTLLIYPAYLWNKASQSPAPEVQPTASTPPMFLAQTRDDDLFDVTDYAKALQKNGTPNHCIAYDSGGHGYGLRLSKDLPASHWPTEAALWIQRQTRK